MRIFILLIIISLSLSTKAQFKKKNSKADSTKTKSGFAWGGTPILAYDSDLGLRYGAVINLFDYGNGDLFPKYLQYVKIKAFNSTKGTSTLSLVLDSDKIFKKTKIISEASFINDIALNFFGFNGFESNFNQNLINHENQLYENKFFYNHRRQWLRGRIDLQYRIAESKYRILLGSTYNSINIGSINPNVLDIPKGRDGNEPTTESLYLYYTDWGVITPNEAKGGNIWHNSLGIIYDSRNNPINCSKGIWFESFLVHSPKLESNPNFAKHIFTYRQYITFSKHNFMFQYRFSSQQKLWGNIPFYYLPVYFDSQMNQDGLGGAFTLRGITRNRIAANGFLLGNIEFRKKILSFPINKLEFDIEISAFSDAAYVTQKYNANYSNIPSAYQNSLLTSSNQDYYLTFGPGMYIIYNVNNIISVNLGFSNEEQLGVRGLYIGSAFLF